MPQMTATQQHEAIDRWVQKYLQTNFFWTTGPLRGCTFSLSGCVEGSPEDTHVRGCYRDHPEFGHISDDSHQLFSLLEDLQNGRCNTGAGRIAPDEVAEDAEDLLYILTGEER